MIHVDKISYAYGTGKNQARVLQDISLDIKNGEIISIVGMSGCGKTTLAKILAGYLKPQNGKITIDSREINGPGNDRMLVFQNENLFPWLTIEENLKLFAMNANIGEHETPEYLLKMVGLQDCTHLYPSQLSGGMTKRIEIIRALCANPEIIILDESFSHLDSSTKEHLYSELLKIWNYNKKTIIIITHDIEEAILLSSRVAIMSARPAKIKQIIEISNPRPHNYNTRYHKEFIKLRKTIKRLTEEN